MPGNEPNFVAIIPARGGSKGIPGKNIKEFLGKPLLAWTVEVALESGVFSRIILSTDDEEIARVGREFGVEAPFLRPAELAQDTALTAPAIRHAIEWLSDSEGCAAEYLMVLEPTAPARRPFHVREAAELLLDSGADSVASVSEVPQHYNPAKVLQLHSDGTLGGIDGTHIRDMVHRRQDLSPYFAFDGLLYACKTSVVLNDPPTLWGDIVHAYIVDQKYNVDLDTTEDWIIGEAQAADILGAERRLYE